MQIEAIHDNAETDVGSYFVANYPPFSAWSPAHVPAALDLLGRAHQGKADVGGAEPPPLGLYLHIPFCRKRCKFCYFRVYTDKNSSDIETYLDALVREVELYARLPAAGGRELDFVYFGGGTPSFLSSDQLAHLVERLERQWTWGQAREVSFECEPGTLRKGKLETIKAIGTTRLSLGVEHFDDEVLTLNGRAHKSPEIFRAYAWAREVGFKEINIDLIAGLLGETEDKWKATVEEALKLEPDSVTIYQMEIPYNTRIARDAKAAGATPPVATWAMKRRWVEHAFAEFERAGYEVSSAYTLVKPACHDSFVYRDALWHGADMLGAGVASFSYVGGMHFQNADQWTEYVATLQRGALPIARALPASDPQRLIREFILQLKRGRVRVDYFREKFGVDIRNAFDGAIASLVADGCAEVDTKEVRLTRAGLLRADALLPRFFEPQFRGVRYT